MTQTVTVKVSHGYEAAPERVFDAWLDPGKAARFLFATPTGQVVRCEIDAKVGGGFVIVDRRPETGEAGHYGTYVEIDRPRRLAFDFAVDPAMTDATRVTVEIAAAGTGCELTLTHAGVWKDYAERTQGGWTMILDGLEKSLA
jgi:uncharacterized protein YndB with AHSA1/START domain